MRAAVACALVAIACLGCGAHQAGPPSVRYVVSGDSVLLEDGRLIRLLGIDAPTGRECHAYLSRFALARLLEPGARVTLDEVRGSEAFVLRGRLDVNLELVREGAASAYFRSVPRGARPSFLNAAERARAAHLGAWGGCSGILDPARPWRLERRAPDRIFR